MDYKDLKKKLKLCRKKYMACNALHNDIAYEIEKALPEDPEFLPCPESAINAENLEQAIDCFLLYGEGDVDDIVTTIEKYKEEK